MDISLEDIFERFSDEILQPTQEIQEEMNTYCKILDELTNEEKFTQEQKDKIKKVFDLIFETEYQVQKQCFVKGFEMARKLLLK